MDAEVSRLQTAYKRSVEAREQEVSMYNPLPPFEQIKQPWPLFQKAYREGDFWSNMKGMPGWKSRPQTNIPFQVVETNTTLLTDSRPTAVPFSDSGHPDDYYLAEALKGAYLQWWNEQYGDLKVTLGVKPSRIFGLGWWRLDAEGETQEWDVIHPDKVLVSPETTVESFLVREPTYLIYEYETQVGALMNAFPKNGTEVKPDWDSFEPKWNIKSSNERLRSMDREDRQKPTRTVTVYQFWERDPSEVVWEEAVGESKVKKAKPKYPGGKVTTMAGGIILDQRANPYQHKMYPFIPVFAYVAPGQFYPIGDIQNILPIVYLRNRLQQLYFDQSVKAGGYKMFLGQGSDLTTEDITNEPVEIVECRDVNQIRVDTFNSPRRDLLEFMGQLDSDIDNTAGIHDISKGARSPGNPVTAQEAMMLGESDRTRIRLASRLLTWSLNRLAKQWCYNAAQFNASKEYVIKVASDPTEEAPSHPGFEQQMVPVAFTIKEIMAGDKLTDGLKYGIKFTEFSSLPSSLQEDKQLAMALFQGGILDEEDLLIALDWPNARYVAQKAKQRAAAQPAMPPGVDPNAPVEQGAQQPPMEQQMPPEMMAAPPMEQDPGAALGIPGAPPEVIDAVDQLVQQGADPEEAVAAVMQAFQQQGVM